MANYYRVSPKFWIKARQRGWTDAQTTLALYVLTCEHRNLEGLYRLPKPYIAADLGWPARKVDEALAAVCASGLAQYDEDAEMILIPKALKHQKPTTENHIRGAVAQLKRIPRTSLWHAFVMACRCHCERLADAIEKEWPSHGNGISHVHAGPPASAAVSSSNSISSSSPPLAPPASAGGEPGHPGSAPQRRGLRANHQNPRAVATQQAALEATDRSTVAVLALTGLDSDDREQWERLHSSLMAAVDGSGGMVAHVADMHPAGVDGSVLVLDAPPGSWEALRSRCGELLPACCANVGVEARLATDDEHAGFQRVAA